MSSTVVVVGHGMVGHRLVEVLRERDGGDSWRVVVVGEEPRQAYDRVALSSYVAEKDAEDLSLVDESMRSDPAVDLRVNTAVSRIDRENRRVLTACGQSFDYDALVLATGSRPFVPPVDGHDLPGVFVYRTLEDLDAIREASKNAASGVVIGGGLLGLEAANALRTLGVRAHVVEMAPWLMPVQVDEGGGHLLGRLVGDLGLDVHTGVGIQAVEPVEDGRAERT